MPTKTRAKEKETRKGSKNGTLRGLEKSDEDGVTTSQSKESAVDPEDGVIIPEDTDPAAGVRKADMTT